MLQVILFLLKIIIFLLLGILCLFLLAVLTVLITPIRYRLEGQYYGKLRGSAKITWLLHILSIKIFWGENLDVSVKLFGFRLNLSPKAEPVRTPDQEGKAEEQPSASPDEVEILQESRKEEDKPEVLTPVTFVEASTGEREPKKRRKKSKGSWSGRAVSFKKKAELRARAMADKLKKLNSGREQLFSYVRDGKNRKTVQLVIKQVRGVFRHIRPRRGKLKLTFGFDDPYYTGQVLSGFSLIYPCFHRHLEISPVFDRKILEGEWKCSGRIRPGALGFRALRVFLDHNFRTLLKKALG